ncbi:hypothetical protein [Pontibacter sp. G13]|uniref:hypothetical protein n=1 Tax=Pontibacter sp. G13 TaxID=3074898 RepID=UPI0028890723|nr:hypothetical protein [Pontibacter sp. G13]WNJ18209.1 hypothetical protein RJD25_25440 [Pontibacter sp. G13]
MTQTELVSLIDLANQLHDLGRKISRVEESHSMHRNLRRMLASLQDLGLEIHDPLGESFDETRTDVEASISGVSDKDLKVIEVIKPILRFRMDGVPQIVQRGVVIAGKPT